MDNALRERRCGWRKCAMRGGVFWGEADGARGIRAASDISGAIRIVHDESGHFGREAALEILKVARWDADRKEAVVASLAKRAVCMSISRSPVKVAPPMRPIRSRPRVLVLVAVDLKRARKQEPRGASARHDRLSARHSYLINRKLRPANHFRAPSSTDMGDQE